MTLDETGHALDRRAMATLAKRLPPEGKKPATPAQKARAVRRARLLAERSAALNGIITRHWKPLETYALRRLGDRADAPGVAKEVVQEVFATLYVVPRKAKSFSLGRPLRPWLKCLVRRQVANYFRVQRHRQLPEAVGDAVPGRAPSPLETAVEEEERRYLAWLVKLLPDDHRGVFRDHYLHELSVAVIAGATGLRPGEVYAILRECQRFLQEAGHLDLREKVRRAALRLRRLLGRLWRRGRWTALLSRITVEVRPDEDTVNRAWRRLSQIRTRVLRRRCRSVRRVTADLQALCDAVCGDPTPG
jgi:RNA polymerase sigma factor (sigma-70 family)